MLVLSRESGERIVVDQGRSMIVVGTIRRHTASVKLMQGGDKTITSHEVLSINGYFVFNTFDHHSVKVTLVDIKHDKVRLGFDADKSVDIWREELWEKM